MGETDITKTTRTLSQSHLPSLEQPQACLFCQGLRGTERLEQFGQRRLTHASPHIVDREQTTSRSLATHIRHGIAGIPR